MCEMCAENVLRLSWIDWLVADIGQHLLEDRKLGFGRGHGQPGLRHQGEQADGLQRDRFAAGVGAADQQRAAVCASSSSEIGTTCLRCRRSTSASSGWRASRSSSRVAEARNGAIEIDGEARLGEEQFQLAQGVQRLADGFGVAAQAGGQLAQDAVDFRASSSVRRTSSLLRSMVSSGSTNSVWPLALAPWITPSILRRCPAIDGHHEALVADGDELFLQHAFFLMGFQDSAPELP